MRFLADESCDFTVVRALRGAGHDVTTVAEARPGAPDEEVLALARSERRILLTEDRDFGRLAFAQGEEVDGVVYIRFPARARAALGPAVVRLADRLGDKLPRRFVVLRASARTGAHHGLTGAARTRVPKQRGRSRARGA